MDETTLKIALAGLMHDMGKLADRAVLEVSAEYEQNNAQLYQPFFNGRFTHSHALYTAAFIEQMKDFLPPQLNAADWGSGDAFINLAAGHHRPETPMQWVIAVADRLSSGWDRKRFEEGEQIEFNPTDYQRIRLYPILERLTLTDAPSETGRTAQKYCYRLTELSAESIFPGLNQSIIPASREAAKEEYHLLAEGFCRALGDLLHGPENVELWFEHFDSLLMAFASCVPAARGGDSVPNVSLYDHSRTTAALAAAIYMYHRDQGTLTVDAVRNDQEQRLLLIMGDFYGIQDFIFSSSGDVRKYRSKLLRGRSFAVSLFSELAADMLCREIGLPFSSVALNAAGKFTIIAPNTSAARQAVASVEKQANDWLKRVSYGENGVGLATAAASGEDFVQGRFRELWDAIQSEMQRKKLRRIDLNQHGGTITGYLDGFNNELKRSLCPLCGKRPSAFDAEDHPVVREAESVCRVCHDHVFLGKNLVGKQRVSASYLDKPVGGRDNRLLEPIFGRYQISFFDEENDLRDGAKDGRLLRCWDMSINDNGQVPHRAAIKLINGYAPRYEKEDPFYEYLLEHLGPEEEISLGDPMSFNDIAARALKPATECGDKCHGVEALGILKADVDNLGALMARGVAPPGKKELFTIARLATLSRQLNFFFSLYLPRLLKSDKRFQHVYTVFAGGDDLFLIGPWNRTMELASHLRQTFSEYVCHNPEVHFSAGIALKKPHAPVEQLAEAAEHDLMRSKDWGRNRLTIFGETVAWDEFTALVGVRDQIRVWLEQKLVNKSMLYRLNGLIDMAAREALVTREKSIRLEDMGCTKWRAYLAYSVERNAAKNLKGGDREREVKTISQSLARWVSEYAGKLRIPLWEILYDIR
jgi:CRISPR-associated protein Csm1